ncbi:hypothetical protein AGDE_12262 [Angomonas deanei]|nr:hypothetical protein AGDE_12262 [Angomonas deanei]|eukprot:EPY24607.1 hypothetical protein AGDE_12262 [Angomonas deanei]
MLRLGLPQWASVGENPVYTLNDMANDCYGLLIALGVLDNATDDSKAKRVHIFGTSMGGMIAQQFCLNYPRCVASMTLHMTHAGIGDCFEPSLLSYLVFLRPPTSRSPEHLAENMLHIIDSLSQNYRYEKDEKGRVLKDSAYNKAVRDNTIQSVLKGYERNGEQCEVGLPRQAVAVMRAPPRLQALRETCGKYKIPVVVLHGGKDPLIPVRNGYQLAEAIPRARLMVYPEMGHDFPEDLSPSFAEQTILNVRAGELKHPSK